MAGAGGAGAARLARRGAVPGRDHRRRRDAVADGHGRRSATRTQRRRRGRRDRPRRPRAQRRRSRIVDGRRALDERSRVDAGRSGAAAAPTRWPPARSRGWPTAASTCATSCGTRSRATSCSARAWSSPQRRPAAGRAPHRRRDLREADRRAAASSPRASPTSPQRPAATRCASPTPTAKAGRSRWPAPSRSSRRPGRPTARELAYVSFESQKAVVWVQDLTSGQRRMLANFRGSQQRAGLVARRPRRWR